MNPWRLVLTSGRPLGKVPRVLGPVQGNGVYHEKIDKTTFNSWSEFPAVFTCCSRPLITSWTSGDNPRPLGVLWEGSQECWVHSRLPQMWFQMRKLLETSSDSCYHFPDTLTGHQLCLITSWTPGGWPRPLGDLREESQGSLVQSWPKAMVYTRRKLIKQPPILGTNSRQFSHVVANVKTGQNIIQKLLNGLVVLT